MASSLLAHTIHNSLTKKLDCRARASAPQRKTSRSRELWEGIAVDYFLGTEVQGGSSGRGQLFVDFEKRVAF